MEEHKAMLSCPCAESDRILAWCLKCGRSTFDPSWLIVAAAFVLIAANAYWWWAL